MYCEKCQALTPENENGCLRCGENARREPQMDDYCFLVEKEMMWGEMLADVLEQNEIPFEIKRALGAGLAVTLGPLSERYAFYVPYRCYEQAQQIVEDLFAVKEDAPADETDADAATDAP